MPDKKTGIERAVLSQGGQNALARRLRERFGIPISQGRVSNWVRIGHLPRKRAQLVAQLTGIPLADLVRLSPRKKPTHGKSSTIHPAGVDP